MRGRIKLFVLQMDSEKMQAQRGDELVLIHDINLSRSRGMKAMHIEEARRIFNGT